MGTRIDPPPHRANYPTNKEIVVRVLGVFLNSEEMAHIKICHRVVPDSLTLTGSVKYDIS
jgi:hypothetical protein